MESSILTQAANYLRKKKRRRIYITVFLCLAAVVAAGTMAVLRMRGQAMNHQRKVLACPLEIHKHTESCYDDEGKLICGYADYVVHTHNADCYDEEGKLVCTLPEIKEHKHEESCWTDKKVLICGLEENQGHIHTEECYDSDGILVCGLEEGDGAHTHTDNCYKTERVLTCGKLELHTHEDSCYEVQEDGSKLLICKETVLEEHIHGEECFITVDLTPEEVEELNKQQAAETEQTDENQDSAGNETENDAENGAEGETAVTPEIPKDALMKQYEDDSVSVTAYYGPEAEIPDEAEIQVYAVTKESAPERYEERVDSALDALGSEENQEDVSAKVLNIGFFLPDGTEVEPAAEVSLIVQFLDEGIPTGAPVQVVHFGKDGTDTYDAAHSEEGTFFSVDSFSDFVFIAGKKAAPIANAPKGRNIAPFLTDAKLTQDGKEIGDGDKVVVGEHYNYHVFFAEKGTGKEERFSSPMYFQLPENVKCAQVTHQPIYDDDYKGGKEPAGWYSVDENGLVTFEFDEEYLNSRLNLKMGLDLDLTVGENSDGKVDLPWDGDGFKKTFETDVNPDVTLEKKMGEYDPADPDGPCIDYTVELEVTKGLVKNPQITDTMGDGLSYRQGSGKVVVFDKDGKDITDQFKPAPSLKKTADGWKVENMPESLEKGEKVIVTYQSDVDFDKIEGNADKGRYNFTAENNATFTGDTPVEGGDPITREDNVKEPLVEQRVQKSGTIDKENNNIDWEIVVGSGSTDVRGAVVTDTLKGNQWIDEERPLELKWKDKNNSTIHTFEIPWTDPNLEVTRDENGHIVSYKYTIPEADAEDSAGNPFWQFTQDDGTVREWRQGDRIKIEYYTDYEGTGTYDNTAIVDVDKEAFKGEGTIGIGAGTISKEGTESEDGKYMEYSVNLSIPSMKDLMELMGTDGSSATNDHVKRPRFFIEDQLEFGSVKIYDDENNSHTARYFVDNFPEDVVITATLADGSVIEFTKDGNVDNSFRVAKYGIDYHADWEEKEKGRREFQIWFNTHYGVGEIDKRDSFWILEQPCTLTITYKVDTSSKLYLEGDDKDADSGLTVRDLLDQGWTLSNEVKARGLKNDFGATHKYTTNRPEFGVSKNALILDVDPEHPFNNEIEYRVEFNAFTTNIVTGEIEETEIDPKTFFLEDTFDSRLEYVPGSMEVHVYSPERRLRVQYRVPDAEADEIKLEDAGNGKTKLSVSAMAFNERKWVDDWNGTYDTLKYYMAHDEGEGNPRSRDAIYIFVYKLRIKDEYITGQELHFDNDAIVHYGDKTSSDDADVDFTPEPLIKNGKHTYDERRTDIVAYTVEVNPGAIDMVTTGNSDYNPGRYTLTDHMDEILLLRSDSIKVYRVEKDGTTTELKRTSDQAKVTPKSDYYVFQEAEGHTFKLILPDEQHILIEYSADVNAIKDATVKVTNSVELEGGMSISDSSDAEFKVDGDSARITGDAKLRLFKQDAVTGNYVGGAEFVLYSMDEDGTVKAGINSREYSFKEYATLTPGDIDGADVGQETGNPGKYYFLVETKAPNGYRLNDEPVVIVFGERGEGDPETVDLVYGGKEYLGVKIKYITNSDNVVVFEDPPDAYSLPKTGGGAEKLMAAGVILFAAGVLGELLLLQKRRRHVR